MKRSKIFLGLTTCILAVVAIVAGAAKKDHFNAAYQVYTKHCSKIAGVYGTLVRVGNAPPLGYTNESSLLITCTTKLYVEGD